MKAHTMLLWGLTWWIVFLWGMWELALWLT